MLRVRSIAILQRRLLSQVSSTTNPTHSNAPTLNVDQPASQRDVQGNNMNRTLAHKRNKYQYSQTRDNTDPRSSLTAKLNEDILSASTIDTQRAIKCLKDWAQKNISQSDNYYYPYRNSELEFTLTDVINRIIKNKDSITKTSPNPDVVKNNDPYLILDSLISLNLATKQHFYLVWENLLFVDKNYKDGLALWIRYLETSKTNSYSSKNSDSKAISFTFLSYLLQLHSEKLNPDYNFIKAYLHLNNITENTTTDVSRKSTKKLSSKESSVDNYLTNNLQKIKNDKNLLPWTSIFNMIDAHKHKLNSQDIDLNRVIQKIYQQFVIEEEDVYLDYLDNITKFQTLMRHYNCYFASLDTAKPEVIEHYFKLVIYKFHRMASLFKLYSVITKEANNLLTPSIKNCLLSAISLQNSKDSKDKCLAIWNDIIDVKDSNAYVHLFECFLRLKFPKELKQLYENELPVEFKSIDKSDSDIIALTTNHIKNDIDVERNRNIFLLKVYYEIAKYELEGKSVDLDVKALLNNDLSNFKFLNEQLIEYLLLKLILVKKGDKFINFEQYKECYKFAQQNYFISSNLPIFFAIDFYSKLIEDSQNKSSTTISKSNPNTASTLKSLYPSTFKLLNNYDNYGLLFSNLKRVSDAGNRIKYLEPLCNILLQCLNSKSNTDNSFPLPFKYPLLYALRELLLSDYITLVLRSNISKDPGNFNNLMDTLKYYYYLFEDKNSGLKPDILNKIIKLLAIANFKPASSHYKFVIDFIQLLYTSKFKPRSSYWTTLSTNLLGKDTYYKEMANFHSSKTATEAKSNDIIHNVEDTTSKEDLNEAHNGNVRETKAL